MAGSIAIGVQCLFNAQTTIGSGVKVSRRGDKGH
jgi:hypothetical protein